MEPTQSTPNLVLGNFGPTNLQGSTMLSAPLYHEPYAYHGASRKPPRNRACVGSSWSSMRALERSLPVALAATKLAMRRALTCSRGGRAAAPASRDPRRRAAGGLPPGPRLPSPGASPGRSRSGGRPHRRAAEWTRAWVARRYSSASRMGSGAGAGGCGSGARSGSSRNPCPPPPPTPELHGPAPRPERGPWP